MEKSYTINTLDKKAHWNLAAEGDDADKVNLVELLQETITSKNLKLKITSGSNQVYYTEPKQGKTSS